MRKASSLSGILLSTALGASAVAQDLEQVDHGIDACPAFDVIQARLQEVVRGAPPEDAGASVSVAVEFILDASGSMAGQIGDSSKMDIARAAFLSAIDVIEPANVQAGLRAYGYDSSLEHSEEASCPNTELLTGFENGDLDALRTAANGLSPYGYTPIAASLEAAAADLMQVEAEDRLIVLLSDGEETCSRNPVEAAAAIEAMDIDVSAYVVGFDLNEAQEDQMQAVARAAGGRYIAADDPQALAEAMQEIAGLTVGRAERQLIRCENPVQGGLSIEEAVLIEPGIYTLGELLEIGDYRYYRVATQEGEMGVIRGLLQSWAYHGEGDEAQEGTIHLGAMSVRMYTPDGEDAGSRPARERDLPGISMAAYFMDTVGDGFVFGIGDNYERATPWSLFEVAVENASDENQGDADADRDGEYPEIDAGGRALGVIGHDDLVDNWRVDASDTVQVTVEFMNEEMRYGISVYDAHSGRRLQRERPSEAVHTFEVEAVAPFVIEVTTREPRLASKHSEYYIFVDSR